MGHWPDSGDDEIKRMALALAMIVSAVNRAAGVSAGSGPHDTGGPEKPPVVQTSSKGSELPARDIMTIGEVAEYLRISKAQCYSLAKRGNIPSFHLDKSVRVRRRDLLKWIEDRMD